jgi:hypothetical protein
MDAKQIKMIRKVNFFMAAAPVSVVVVLRWAVQEAQPSSNRKDSL